MYAPSQTYKHMWRVTEVVLRATIRLCLATITIASIVDHLVEPCNSDNVGFFLRHRSTWFMVVLRRPLRTAAYRSPSCSTH